MRFTVTMKHADALFYAMQDVRARAREGLSNYERSYPDPDVIADKVNEAEEFARRFMKYGEYISVEFDTDAGTATVLEVSR